MGVVLMVSGWRIEWVEGVRGNFFMVGVKLWFSHHTLQFIHEILQINININNPHQTSISTSTSHQPQHQHYTSTSTPHITSTSHITQQTSHNIRHTYQHINMTHQLHTPILIIWQTRKILSFKTSFSLKSW